MSLYKLVVIVGPTASGKSGLAIKVAKDFNGEIISADSLTVYKNMDIGTAKPSLAERKQIRHWGFDLIGPGQRYTAAEFKDYAQSKIADIEKRGKLPMIVGGTGLYVDALLFDFGFSTKAAKRDPINPRHLSKDVPRISQKIKPGTLVIGLMPDNEKLRNRIMKRVEAMFAEGLIVETKHLLSQYGRESLLAKAKVAYGPVIEYLDKKIDLDGAKKLLEIAHWRYARRQKTWFKRSKFIHWFSSADRAYTYIKDQLNT